jgi:hypothetical protein
MALMLWFRARVWIFTEMIQRVSRSIKVLAIGTLCAVVALSACSSVTTRSEQTLAVDRVDPVKLAPLSASAGVGGGAVRTDVASSSIVLDDYVPVRRYHDIFTVDGKNQKVIVEYGWDYRKGVAIERVYSEQGVVQSQTEKPGYTMNFTDRELELAIALAREEPTLRSLLADTELNYYAGFPYREVNENDCNERSRCVHVIVSAGDGQRHVAHAIVDLMTRQVIHPSLDPDRKPDLSFDTPE